MKLKYFFALTLLMPILGFGIESNSSKYDHLKGVLHVDASDLKYFNGFTYEGCKQIDDEYQIAVYKNGNTFVYIFRKEIKVKNSSEKLYSFLDALEVKGLSGSEKIYFDCLINDREVKEVIAVADNSGVKNAWEFSTIMKKIKEHPTDIVEIKK